MKVFVATPTFDGKVCNEYLLSLLRLKEATDFKLCLIPGVHFVDMARDIAAAKFLKTDCTHLMFIDSDMGFPPDAVNRLIAHDKPVVGGAYRIRHDEELYPTYGGAPSFDLHQVQILGGGFMCVQRHVIEALWGAVPHYNTAHVGEVAAMFSREIHDGVMVSEDVMFCRRVAGFGVWLDPNIDFDHVGGKTYSGNYRQYLQGVMSNETDIQE